VSLASRYESSNGGTNSPWYEQSRRVRTVQGFIQRDFVIDSFSSWLGPMFLVTSAKRSCDRSCLFVGWFVRSFISISRSCRPDQRQHCSGQWCGSRSRKMLGGYRGRLVSVSTTPGIAVNPGNLLEFCKYSWENDSPALRDLDLRSTTQMLTGCKLSECPVLDKCQRKSRGIFVKFLLEIY